MMRNNVLPFSIFILLTFICFLACSQSFSYETHVQKITESGWHSIVLTPEVISNSKNDLSDIRVFNLQGKEVPYGVLSQHKTAISKETLVYASVKKESFTIQNDTIKKITSLLFSFKKPQLLHEIILHIDTPSYFYREAILYVYRVEDRKKEPLKWKAFFESFIISSRNKLILELNNLLTQEFCLEIANNDNMPLRIVDVELRQLAPLLIADLNKDEQYVVKFGDFNLKSPNYDITHFIDWNKKMPLVHLTEVVASSASVTKTKNETPSYWQRPWFLWCSIAFGALILFFFSRSLIKEMKNK